MKLYADFPQKNIEFWGLGSCKVSCDLFIRKLMKLFGKETLYKDTGKLALKIIRISSAILSYVFTPSLLILSNLTSCVLFPSTSSVVIAAIVLLYVGKQVGTFQELSDYFENTSLLSKEYLKTLKSEDYDQVVFNKAPLIAVANNWVNSAISTFHAATGYLGF